jgi:hypothetical protein
MKAFGGACLKAPQGDAASPRTPALGIRPRAPCTFLLPSCATLAMRHARLRPPAACAAAHPQLACRLPAARRAARALLC